MKNMILHYITPSFQNQFIMEKLQNNNYINNKNNLMLDCKNTEKIPEKKYVFEFEERTINKLFTTKINKIYSHFFTNFKFSILNKKITKAYLSLFITFTNSKIKNKKIQNDVNDYN